MRLKSTPLFSADLSEQLSDFKKEKLTDDPTGEMINQEPCSFTISKILGYSKSFSVQKSSNIQYVETFLN